jgi:23S rRNA (cytosine1962-C5)-methyltransferase
MQVVRLKQGCEKRLIKGHKWVFSNEITEPLKNFSPGWVKIYSHKEAFIGTGYINPHSLIAVRIISRNEEEPGRAIFLKRIAEALERKKSLYPESNALRIIYGESDNLPGLILDRYGDVFVCQANTLCMSEHQEIIKECILELFSPKAIVFRNDSRARILEGLKQEKYLAYGRLPERVLVKMNGLNFDVDVLNGQKTGLFLDQRDNREALRKYAPGRSVLDFYCYDGAWSLVAESAGAAGVTGIDSSPFAVERAKNNASINNLGCKFIEAEALDVLKSLTRNSQDMIILDPPAFAKSKKDLPDAIRGYIDINRRALLALKPGGILVSCSCSYNMSYEDFHEVILKAAVSAGKELRLLESRGQALDHPVLLAMPETAYLKCLILVAI